MRIHPETLKKLRKALGWSQQELADRAKSKKRQSAVSRAKMEVRREIPQPGSSPALLAWETPGY